MAYTMNIVRNTKTYVKESSVVIRTKEIRGQQYVHIDDLYPDPNNIRIYGSETEEDSRIKELSRSMLKRIKNDQCPNTDAIAYHPDGMQDRGHTRVKAAKYAGIEWLRGELTDNPYPDGSLPHNDIENLMDSNIYRVKSWSVKLSEYQILKDSYREQYGVDASSKILDEFALKCSTTRATLNKLAQIKVHKPELLEKVDEGASIDHCWKEATGQLNTKVFKKKKNGLDIAKLFEDKSIKSRIITKANKFLLDIRDIKFYMDYGEVSPFGHDACGVWESGAFTTMVSHAYMTAIACVLKEQEYNVRTATGHRDDPDIFIIEENERIEVKVTLYKGHGAATKWSGGRGIREGYYINIIHDLDYENIFVVGTEINKPDWNKPDINAKRTLHLDKWYNNHKDDMTIWKGNVTAVKSKKFPDGQVQVIMAPVNEPI